MMDKRYFRLNNCIIEYFLIVSKRKYLTLSFNKNAQLIVKAPEKLNLQRIEPFLLENKKWIMKHKNSLEQQKTAKDRFQLKEGSELSFRGKKYLLFLTKVNFPLTGFVDLELFTPEYKWENYQTLLGGKDFSSLVSPKRCCFMEVSSLETTEEDLRFQLNQIYRQEARDYFQKRLLYWQDKMKVKVHKWCLSNAKTRWGSCSSQKDIRLSWKLILATDFAIDYVIIHELAHCLQMNHSPQFWQIVSLYCPDYPKARLELKALQNFIHIQSW